MDPPERAAESSGGKMPVRILRIARRAIAPLFVGGNLLLALQLYGAGDTLRSLGWMVAIVITTYAIVNALSGELFSPRSPTMRLLPIPDASARVYYTAVRTVLQLAMLLFVCWYATGASGYSPALASLFSLALKCLGVVFAVSVIARAKLIRRILPSGSGGVARTIRLGVALLYPFAVIAILIMFLFDALGFVRLANYVVMGSFLSLLCLVGAVLGYRLLSRGFGALILPEDNPEGGIVSPLLVGSRQIINRTFKILLVALYIAVSLALWDLGIAEARDFLGRDIALLSMVFNTNEQPMNLLMLGKAALVLVSAVLLSRYLEDALTYFILPKTGIERGVGYALCTVLRYIIVGGGIIAALASLGLNMASLSWFFGFAGIGLGFGLQNIFSNFVSGLILLIEHQIRVGDHVQVGDVVGVVEQIRPRGTFIRSPDSFGVIIPNSKFISDQVTNLSYGGAQVRILIDVGVAYGSDLSMVRDVLLEVAQRDRRVSRRPPPEVAFQGFGDSSLDLRLQCFVDNLEVRLRVRSDLHFAVDAAFRRAGIEIPFPQRDLHFKDKLPVEDDGGAK